LVQNRLREDTDRQRGTPLFDMLECDLGAIPGGSRPSPDSPWAGDERPPGSGWRTIRRVSEVGRHRRVIVGVVAIETIEGCVDAELDRHVDARIRSFVTGAGRTDGPSEAQNDRDALREFATDLQRGRHSLDMFTYQVAGATVCSASRAMPARSPGKTSRWKGRTAYQ